MNRGGKGRELEAPSLCLSQEKLYTRQDQRNYGNDNRCIGQILTRLLLHQSAKVIYICTKHLVFFPQLSNQAVMLRILFRVLGKLLILTSMEDQVGWHHRVPTEDEYQQAMQELEVKAHGLCQ